MNKKVQLVSAAAGFPSPAENYIEEQLDLFLITRPST